MGPGTLKTTPANSDPLFSTPSRAISVHPEPDAQADLVRRCRAGEASAWTEVYNTYSGRVASFLRRMLGSDPELEDMVQLVFEGFFRSIHRYRGEASVNTWLYRIASNVAGKRIRTATRTRRRRRALAEHQLALPPAGRDAEHDAEVSANMRILEQILEHIGAEHRSVWTLREVEGLSGDEVAEALGIPTGTVRSRLYHARRKILDGFARRGMPEQAQASTRRASDGGGGPRSPCPELEVDP